MRILAIFLMTLLAACHRETREHGAEGRRFVDTSENALYWHFIVASWLLVYGVIYWLPRTHG